MRKYTLEVQGMQCGMCESHVNDAVRRAFRVKKVESSHSTVGAVRSEPYEKKGFFSSWKK